MRLRTAEPRCRQSRPLSRCGDATGGCRGAARAAQCPCSAGSHPAPDRLPPAPTPHHLQEWHALIANADFFCNEVHNEAIAEQLRERARYYNEQGRETDFFLVPNPKWLDAKYPDKAKQVRRPCMALVSSDTVWIT